MNTLLSNRASEGYLLTKPNALVLIIVPTSVFLFSLVATVMASLPKIYDDKIELNQLFIASMSVKKYREFVSQKTDEGKLGDFIDEIHVLSRILNDKNKLVNRAACLFLLAVITMLFVVAVTII